MSGTVWDQEFFRRRAASEQDAGRAREPTAATPLLVRRAYGGLAPRGLGELRGRPVERILSRFPGVTAAAVYPVPDPVTGDQVMAALEFPSGDFDPGSFGAICSGSSPSRAVSRGYDEA